MLFSTCRLKREIENFSQKDFREFVNCLSDWISFPEDCDANRRNRFFNFRLLFRLFLFQVLRPECSCRETVSEVISLLVSKKRKIPSPNTGSYCKARKKMSPNKIKEILQSLIERSQEEIRKDLLWCGRVVKVVDGTTCSLSDTKSNQEVYPQPGSQKPGCGFPMMRLVVIFSLSLGTILKWSKGAYAASEKFLFRSLLDYFKKSDVLLADRGFDSYGDFDFLMKRGVNFVIRAREKNRKNILILKSLGKRDHLVRLCKPGRRSSGIDKETWNAMPEWIVLRRITYCIETKGFRTKRVTILTDLLDPKDYPGAAFKSLYLRRWRAELFLRDIKITLGMDQLKCKSPEMVEKELYMYIIGYNLIRNIIYRATLKKGVSVDRLSFKGTVNLFIYFMPLFETAEEYDELQYILDQLYETVAKMKNPWRPNRREPRAKKRRPKRYQLLTKHRSLFQEDPHRGKRQNS